MSDVPELTIPLTSLSLDDLWESYRVCAICDGKPSASLRRIREAIETIIRREREPAD